MILHENKFGYDPDEYDDEPSDYVNSETAYDADDISEAEDELEEDDLEDDEDDPDNLDNEVIDDDSDVDENDPINDDETDYPVSDPAAHHKDKKPVYIKDMPYIDHATPGVTSH